VYDTIESCLLRDRRRLHAKLRQWQVAPADSALRLELEQQIQQSSAVAARRAASLPRPSFPAELPISERVDEIRALIRDNQVIVLCGETGSGKSTQLPKICS